MFLDQDIVTPQGNEGETLRIPTANPVNFFEAISNPGAMERTEILGKLFLPVGGGSIAAGMAIVFSALSPQTKIYGVQAENAPAMHHAWHTGEERPFAVTDTIADGLAVRVPVDTTLNVLRDLLATDLLAWIYSGAFAAR